MPQENVTPEFEDGWRDGMTNCAALARAEAKRGDLGNDAQRALLDFAAKVEKWMADKIDPTLPGHEEPADAG